MATAIQCIPRRLSHELKNITVIAELDRFLAGERALLDSPMSFTRELINRIHDLGSFRAPALQINIAREGGQQVNLQGEMNGQTTTPTVE